MTLSRLNIRFCGKNFFFFTDSPFPPYINSETVPLRFLRFIDFFICFVFAQILPFRFKTRHAFSEQFVKTIIFGNPTALGSMHDASLRLRVTAGYVSSKKLPYTLLYSVRFFAFRSKNPLRLPLKGLSALSVSPCRCTPDGPYSAQIR